MFIVRLLAMVIFYISICVQAFSMEDTNSFDTYVLPYNKDGKNRLKLLNKEDNPVTMIFLQSLSEELNLKNAESMNILTVGCGIAVLEKWMATMLWPKSKITATDISKDFLSIGRDSVKRKNICNVNFIEANVCDLSGLVNIKYELVYARFLFEHLAEPDKAIAEIKTILKPKGLLIIEDEEFSSHYTEPASGAYVMATKLARDVGQLLKVDYDIGPKLEALIRRSNDFSIVKSYKVPMTSGEQGLRLFEETLREAHEFMVKHNLVTQEEVDKMLLELKDVTDNANKYVLKSLRFQICARLSDLGYDQ